MGAQVPNLRKKVTLDTIRSMYKRGEPITVLTAHDFPSGHVADIAGMEIVLVGDSLAMVALGMEDTSEILLEEMLLHCRSVSRAAKTAFTVKSSRRLPKYRTDRLFSGRRSAYGIL
jgi:3-methyl-2-oxobutanoate hydroxymethyltransferase